MSRIGKMPVMISAGAQVQITPQNEVVVKGLKSTQKIPMLSQVSATVSGNEVILTRVDDTRSSRALHGLYRALVQNAVTGVTKGFSRTLELVGVGYRANVVGKNLELTLGFSHPVSFPIPEGIEMKVDKQVTVHITGANKALVGQVAAKIRSFKPPEPFLGKGIKYNDEVIRRKAGKAGKAGK